MKVGDLVRLKEHCKQSGRLAVVVELPDASFGLHCVKIMFFDNPIRIPATKNNLEVLSEGR